MEYIYIDISFFNNNILMVLLLQFVQANRFGGYHGKDRRATKLSMLRPSRFQRFDVVVGKVDFSIKHLYYYWLNCVFGALQRLLHCVQYFNLHDKMF